MRAAVAGELAEAWKSSGGSGPQLTNLANVLAVAVQTNQETVGRLMEAQSREWQQMARDRRNIKEVELQLKEPNLPRINWVADGQRRDTATRNSGKEEKDQAPSKNKEQSKQGRGGSGRERSGGKGSDQRRNSDGNGDYDNFRRKGARGGYGGAREEGLSSKNPAYQERS